jgi:chromosome segregation ATPase
MSVSQTMIEENSEQTGSAVEGLAEMIGELAATLDRVHELPGRVADAKRFRCRLVLRRAEVDRKIRSLNGELTTAKETRREFNARRIAAEIRSLDEERIDIAIMLGEVDRVLQRLRRERRTLLFRLESGEALLAAFPAGPKRTALVELLSDARQSLVARTLVGIGDE